MGLRSKKPPCKKPKRNKRAKSLRRFWLNKRMKKAETDSNNVKNSDKTVESIMPTKEVSLKLNTELELPQDQKTSDKLSKEKEDKAFTIEVSQFPTPVRYLNHFNCADRLFNSYFCPHCSYRTNTKVNLKKHNMGRHLVPLQLSQTVLQTYHCRDCLFETFSLLVLMNHVCGERKEPNLVCSKREEPSKDLGKPSLKNHIINRWNLFLKKIPIQSQTALVCKEDLFNIKREDYATQNTVNGETSVKECETSYNKDTKICRKIFLDTQCEDYTTSSPVNEESFLEECECATSNEKKSVTISPDISEVDQEQRNTSPKENKSKFEFQCSQCSYVGKNTALSLRIHMFRAHKSTFL